MDISEIYRLLGALGAPVLAFTAVAPLSAQDAPVADIIVMSTRADRPVADEPLKVEVLGREEVEDELVMTSSNIMGLLDGTAGLRLQPTSPLFGGTSVRVKGLRGRYTPILTDGLPLYGSQSGSLGPLQIPLMDIGRVEVIEGAASALYGATSLGGVVNLISRRPAGEKELLLNGTTLGGSDAVLWMADEWNASWGYTFLGAVHRQGQGDVDDDGWADVPGFRRVLVRPRLFWDDGGGRSLLATIGGVAEDREGGTLEGTLDPSGRPFPAEVSTRYVDIGVVARAATEGGRLFALRGSTSLLDHGHTYGDRPEDDRHTTAFVEASLTGTSAGHIWVVGAALQRDVYRAEDLQGFDYTHSVPALFIQDEVILTSALSVSASARLDAHSKYGTWVSPRLSGLLRLDPWTARASAGIGLFAPTPFTEETEAVGLFFVAPLRGVRAERARSASLDLGRTLGPLELNATLFAASIENAVAAVPAEARAFLVGTPTAGGGLYALINQADPTRTWGGELRVRYGRERLHVTGTYAYTRATESAFECLRRPAVAAELGFPCQERSRREVPRTPLHTAGALAAWGDENRGRVGVDLYYVGRQELEDDPFRTLSRGYLVFGVLVEKRLGGARVFLNGQNLLDARQTRWSPLVRRDRSPRGKWTTDVWAPPEGRVFNAGVRFSL